MLTMRCFGWFNDNELCDMCREVLTRKYDKCKQTYKDKINKQKELDEIRDSCIYCIGEFDEYTPFYACNKRGMGYGSHADRCRPTLECKTYKATKS